MRADFAPGGTFPDYDSPDHTSVRRRLSEPQGDDPLILTLARGHYRPDWELRPAGFREAWDPGDWSPFNGWETRAPAAMPGRR